MTGISWKLVIWVVLITAPWWAVIHYHSKSQEESYRADMAEGKLALASATITDMQSRQRDVAALDAKYTGELANAKATIEQLQRDVAAGTKRLHFAATCTGVSDSSGTGGVGNASTPTITAGAERDYWRLRDGINTVTGQVKYLQDYIRQQCVK